MKKLALLVLALVAVGFCNTSCQKNQTCKCTEYFQGLYVEAEIFDTEAEGLKKCSELQERLNMRYAGGGTTFTCSKL